MSIYIRSPLTYLWLFLSTVTVVSWLLGSGRGAASYRVNVWVTAAVLLIALVKTRFVIRNYMEVRFAPSWLQLTCDAWLIAVFGMISGFYWASL